LARYLPAEPVMPAWLSWAQAVALALLCAATWIWPTLKPLCGYVLALLAFWVGWYFIRPSILESSAWSNWVQQTSWGVALVATQVMDHVGPVVLMVLTLIGSGLGRRELFLVRGDPQALAGPTWLLPGLRKPRPWNRVILLFLPFFVVILVIVLGLQVRPGASRMLRALIFLPATVIAAAINAIGEEFEYRSMLLSRLEPAFGPRQAIVMTFVFFGVQHYYGAPSGPFGVLLSAFLGWVMAKSMIETRGIVWAFFLHFVADFLIYTFWAMAAG
jgi:membrane protease YdiL (CAAX protease family)